MNRASCSSCLEGQEQRKALASQKNLPSQTTNKQVKDKKVVMGRRDYRRREEVGIIERGNMIGETRIGTTKGETVGTIIGETIETMIGEMERSIETENIEERETIISGIVVIEATIEKGGTTKIITIEIGRMTETGQEASMSHMIINTSHSLTDSSKNIKVATNNILYLLLTSPNHLQASQPRGLMELLKLPSSSMMPRAMLLLRLYHLLLLRLYHLLSLHIHPLATLDSLACIPNPLLLHSQASHRL